MKRGAGAVPGRAANEPGSRAAEPLAPEARPSRAAPDTASGATTERDLTQEKSPNVLRPPAARGPAKGAAV